MTTPTLPPLPEPSVDGTAYEPNLKICYTSKVNYTPDQMLQHREDYARPAVEALRRLCRHFPTDTDQAEAGWPSADINAACDVYDAARAVLSLYDKKD